MLSNNKWVAAGRPRAGVLLEDIKKDKYVYRCCIRQNKKRELGDITNSLHDSLLSKKPQNFWKTWNNKFASKPSLAKFINGKSGDLNIANEFATSFENACNFNSALRNDELRSDFLKLKATCLNNEVPLVTDDDVSVELIDGIISKLKPGKAASFDNVTVEHIKHSHPIIVSLISKLFQLMLHYNYVPNDFGKSLTVALPKNNTFCSANTEDYRGISISPVISKIFEHVLLARYSKYLVSSALQFGFKCDSSCSHAIYTARKTIDYFVERDSTVNVCAIDLAKAFDKVNKYALFIKLLKRGCPLKFIELLDNWYDKCFTCVKWGNSLSRFIKLNAGVRQGGILSPALFAVYVDDILVLLRNSGLGCHIGQLCCSAFMFADDLMLLSIAVSDLQKMIDICKRELDWLDMIINITKSSYLRIGKRHCINIGDIVISGIPLPKASEIRYLGVYIESGRKFKCNMHHSKIKYFRSLNGILGRVSMSASTDVILSLVSAFATPILLYGLETGCLKSKELDKLNYPFRSIFCKLFSTFDSNVIEQCQYFTWQLPLKMLVHLRCLYFFNKLELGTSSPASLLYRWFGNSEKNSIAMLYDISSSDRPYQFREKIWYSFKCKLNI